MILLSCMKFLLMGLCILFDIAYIVCKSKDKNIVGLLVKTAAAACFLQIGNLGYMNHQTNYAFIIMCGLGLDAIGDICLGLRNLFLKNLFFVLGSSFFLAGHVVFINALFPYAGNYKLECIIAGIILGTLLLTILSKVCRLSRTYTILGMLYCIMISIMVSLGIGVYLTNKTVSDLLFMMGAVLFVSSDIILILYNFSKKEKWMHPIYSILYFIAQILISFSLNL